MASTPRFKVYTADKEYVAAFKYPSDAAVLISALGDGATIRLGHTQVVWTEGHEHQPAAESYDFVAETIHARQMR